MIALRHVRAVQGADGYSGVLSSPLFGQPTGFMRGRTVRLSMHVDF